MHANSFLEEVHERILTGDGAIGTELFRRGADMTTGAEICNLTHPEIVRELHSDYVRAGSRIIETNTFAANLPHFTRRNLGDEQKLRDVLAAGCKIACAAANPDIYIAGSIGPIGACDGDEPSDDEKEYSYRLQAETLVENGAHLIIIESFGLLNELEKAVRQVKSMVDLPVVAQASFDSKPRTADGASPEEVLMRCREAGADVVGANCGHGAMSVLRAVHYMSGLGMHLSAYANAGFPEYVDGRLVYMASADYIADRAYDCARMGARIVGGCCGTGPETVRRIAERVDGMRVPIIAVRSRPEPESESAVGRRRLLAPGTEFPVMVELDTPKSTDLGPMIEKARELRNAGATHITVADNPLASVRLDNLTAASEIARKVQIAVVPHLTGRDRNRIALQSYIMAAHAVGVRSILCLTGDPPGMCSEETSGVFDLNSVSLVRMVADFNSGARLGDGTTTDFSIGVAFSPEPERMAANINKLSKKMEAGAHYALTQPIYSRGDFTRVMEEVRGAGIDIPIYIGIMPLVNLRNAEFLHNEVPGIQVPENVLARLRKHETGLDQLTEGLDIAMELVTEISQDADGLYLITPRGRTEVIAPLIATIHPHETRERFGI